MNSYKMTPEDALERLMEGNQIYLESKQSVGDISKAIRRKTMEEGQEPYAIIVTCSDSRVIPEAIFSAGIGELFVIRVAGNVIDKHQLGSIQYAAEHLGSRLLMVLGHTNCGAVDAAINHKNEGYVKYITDEIQEAIGEEKDSYKACCLNVSHSLHVVKNSLIRKADKDSGMRVVGAVYHLEDGSVELLPEPVVFLNCCKECDKFNRIRFQGGNTMALKSSVERAQRVTGGFAYAKKHIVIQYKDKEQPESYLLDLIRRDITAKGIKDAEIQEIDVYIKPEDSAVYYVLNKEIQGSVEF